MLSNGEGKGTFRQPTWQLCPLLSPGTAGSRRVRAKPPTTCQEISTGLAFLKTLCRLYLKGDKEEKVTRYKMMSI